MILKTENIFQRPPTKWNRQSHFSRWPRIEVHLLRREECGDTALTAPSVMSLSSLRHRNTWLELRHDRTYDTSYRRNGLSRTTGGPLVFLRSSQNNKHPWLVTDNVLGMPVKPCCSLLSFLFCSVVFRESHVNGCIEAIFVPFEISVLRNVLNPRDACMNGQYSSKHWSDRRTISIKCYLLQNRHHLELFIQVLVLNETGYFLRWDLI